MGTRHLICVFIDDEYKVAQYGQWDGYPEGQGVRVLEFLKTMDKARFIRNVKQCVYITDEDIDELWENFAPGAIDKKTGLVDYDIAQAFGNKYPELSRDTSAEILHMIHEKPLKLRDSITFALDSLFCEWCYVIDLDKDTFEVYKGFNKDFKEEETRFKLTTKQKQEEIDKNKDNNGYNIPPYGAVSLAKSYPLSELPTEEEFLNDFKYEEED